jgi:hypothetical protein
MISVPTDSTMRIILAVVVLGITAYHLHDLARLDIDHPGIDSEVTVQVDKRADHVARADQLADFRRGFLVHSFGHGKPARQDPLSFSGRPADFRVIRQLVDQHGGQAFAQGVEVLLSLPGLPRFRTGARRCRTPVCAMVGCASPPSARLNSEIVPMVPNRIVSLLWAQAESQSGPLMQEPTIDHCHSGAQSATLTNISQ